VNLGLGQANTLACPVILKFGTEEQKLRFLPKVASGEIRFSYAVTEPDGKLSNYSG
jgi:alkylation response protein AidB-like acyl-CoA dehydrogenase